MRAPAISLKTEQDVEKLRISGRLAAEVLAMMGSMSSQVSRLNIWMHLS